ncbi:hypothetical protein CEUSTIGMA_g3718.t1 [Chlamydomonas eustigma]|uniref:Protein kinase domain-containing protein n=1 Tax=Chlamydomonas eustigma TaxID=1157962 RepID=A0A250WZK0_9CHLO|nr:hypothetical protein CEUSTIGMA_g3718.t1 [Chlamydomonas eustigma]|eukprot:GAX76274.1 hypothetical protein CEUSTIGMA_g3718.t1 [Chlamydomonas eustigma]
MPALICSFLSCFRGSQHGLNCVDDGQASHHGASKADLCTYQKGNFSSLQHLIPLPPIDKPGDADRSVKEAQDDILLQENHESISALRKQERTIRVLLEKAKMFKFPQQTPGSFQAYGAGTSMQLNHEAVSTLKDQLKQCCNIQRPGPDSFLQATQLLSNLQSWLSSQNASWAAAVTLLYIGGEALAQTEHMVRSAGQVQYWTAPTVHTLTALMNLYTSLMESCKQGLPQNVANVQSQPVHTEQDPTSHQAEAESLDLRSGPDASDKGPQVGAGQAHSAACMDLLTSTLFQLLVRPSLMELLVEVLELVHDSHDYAKSCERHVAVSTSVCLWRHVQELFAFAGNNVSAAEHQSKRSHGCLIHLSRLLSPPAGLVPRLLSKSLNAENFAVQYNVLQLLQQLFRSPKAIMQQVFGASQVQLLQKKETRHSQQDGEMPDVSSACTFYTSLHLREAFRFYYAAAGDPSSAFSELSSVHLNLLRSLLKIGFPEVLSSAHSLGAVDMLLSEIHLQYLDAEQVDTTAATHDREGAWKEKVDLESSDYAATLPTDTGASPSPLILSGVSLGVPASKMRSSGLQTASDKFVFSYDLNEDLERIMEMENNLGSSVQLDGFEYDEEGRQILKQNLERASLLGSSDRGTEWKDDDQSENSQVSVVHQPPVPRLSLSTVSRSAISVSRGSGGGGGGGASTTRSMNAPSHSSERNLSHRTMSHRPPLPVPPLNLPPRIQQSEQLTTSSRKHAKSTSLSFDTIAQHMTPAGSKTKTNHEAQLTHCETANADVRTGPVNDDMHLSRLSIDSLHPGPHTLSTYLPQPAVACTHPDVHTEYPLGEPPTRTPALLEGNSGSQRLPASKQLLIPSLDLSSLTSSGAGNKSTHRTAASTSSRFLGFSSSRHSRVPDSAMHSLHQTEHQGLSDRSQAFPTQSLSIAVGANLPQTKPTADLSAYPVSKTHLMSAREEVYGCTKKEVQSPASSPSPVMSTSSEARLLARDSKIQCLVLQLLLELSISPQGGLEPAYWLQYPLDQGQRYNIEYLLTWYCSTDAAALVVQEVASRLNGKLLKGKSTARKGGLLSELTHEKVGTEPARNTIKAVGCLCLLRLMSRRLFDEVRYTELKFQARGAYGSIFRAKMLGKDGATEQVMVKVVELPGSLHERCVLPDVYGEVRILERYRGVRGICQLIDYGLAPEAYWVIMKKYRCSLSEWRQRQVSDLSSAARTRLYLAILVQIVEALQILAKDSVVHFDLKCSNVLIDPLLGVKDSELWNPLEVQGTGGSRSPSLEVQGTGGSRSPPPLLPIRVPFQSVLADFGEARSYQNAEEAYTARNRGTEVYKSPEMLLMNNRGGSSMSSWQVSAARLSMSNRPPQAEKQAATSAETQAGKEELIKQQLHQLTTDTPSAPQPGSTTVGGAGLASDVWSLGCLAFELLSGSVLFSGDYASVTHRVAFGGLGNLRLTTSERAALGNRAELVDVVEWILERDPSKRPSLGSIAERLELIAAHLKDEKC